MAETIDLATIYDRAADWLEGHEWIQGFTARDKNGMELVGDRIGRCAVSACAGGAIYAVSPDTNVGLEAWDALSTFIGQTLHAWNDARKRTKPEVIAKLREAAAAHRKTVATP